MIFAAYLHFIRFILVQVSGPLLRQLVSQFFRFLPIKRHTPPLDGLILLIPKIIDKDVVPAMIKKKTQSQHNLIICRSKCNLIFTLLPLEPSSRQMGPRIWSLCCSFASDWATLGRLRLWTAWAASHHDERWHRGGLSLGGNRYPAASWPSKCTEGNGIPRSSCASCCVLSCG